MKLLSVAFAIVTGIFACGCGYTVRDYIDNYDDFLRNYLRYGNEQTDDQPSNDETTDTSLFSVEGFVPLCESLFSYGKSFGGGIAYVIDKTGHYILTRDGKLQTVSTDLREVTLIGDKYVYEENGRVGVRNVYGKTLLDARYDSVEISGDTVLARREQYAETYVRGEKVGSSAISISVFLVSETCVFVDRTFCALDFTPLIACGLPYLDLPSDGIVMVACGNGWVTYADINSQRLFAGEYETARRFCEGTAIVTTQSGETRVIDTQENVLYATQSMQISDKSGEYYCFLQYNRYGVLDSSFRVVVDPIFPFVKYERAVDGYLIVRFDDGERLFDLDERTYVEDVYDSIEYADGLFFGYVDGGVTVLDADLKNLVKCDYASYNEGVLCVCKDGQYGYYVREA